MRLDAPDVNPSYARNAWIQNNAPYNIRQRARTATLLGGVPNDDGAVRRRRVDVRRAAIEAAGVGWQRELTVSRRIDRWRAGE